VPPLVRVVDAALHERGGPVELVVTGLDRAREVADAVLHAGASASMADGRLHVVAKPSQLVDAAGRTGGAELAEPLRGVVEAALAAHGGAVPDVRSPAGPLQTGSRPLVMGIVNVTPDSFSDGGEHADADAAVAHGERLSAAGADVLDVGGESTRPGAEPVSADEEIARVVPVIQRLAAAGHLVSVDTTKARVAREAVAAGAALVNDVSAGRFDPELLPAVAELGVPYVLMHMQGAPGDMQDHPVYDDVVGEVIEFLAAGLVRLAAEGVPSERVLIDPGIGFGKTLVHNLTLLDRLHELTSLGRPILVGASRKTWLGTVTGEADPSARVVGSAVAAALAVRNGARMVRVHDVAETVEAVAVADALRLAD
jgi:dihydropteroate synthase